MAGRSDDAVWAAMRPVLHYDPRFGSGAAPKRRLIRIVLAGIGAVALGSAVGGWLIVVNPARYAATGWLLGLGVDGASPQDERAIAESDAVIDGIVKLVGARRLAPFCADCAAAVVKSDLRAAVPGSPQGIGSAAMLRLTAVHADPAVAAAMVDAAVTMDRQVWSGIHATGHAGLEDRLAQAQDALADTSKAAARVRAEAHVTVIGQDIAAAAGQAADIARRQGELRLRNAAAHAELAVVRAEQQATPATIQDSREVTTGDPWPETRSMLLQLRLERAHMAQLYTPDYPGLGELDRKIQTTEATIRQQAKGATAVTRDIRNPLLGALTAQAASLETETAGLAEQLAELDRQAAEAVAREAVLRRADARLTTLQGQAAAETAAVQQLSAGVAGQVQQDSLNVAALAKRHLLQPPMVAMVPWTGPRFAIAAGLAAGLLYALVAMLLTRRRRLRMQAAGEWAAPVPNVPRVDRAPVDVPPVALAIAADDFATRPEPAVGERAAPVQSLPPAERAPADVPPAALAIAADDFATRPEPASPEQAPVTLTGTLNAAAGMRIFALHREGGARSLPPPVP